MKTEEPETISVAIVDDHPVVRGGLEALLLSERGFRVLGCAASGSEALELCRAKGAPNVLLLDIRMPEMDGFTTLVALKKACPGIRVLMLAGMPLKHEEARARELGARGYLSKSAEQDRIVGAIRQIAADPSAFIQESYQPAGPAILTSREVEILECLSRGLSREDIAATLSISAETVKSHVKAILEKLNASGRAEAVSRGYELGLLRA